MVCPKCGAKIDDTDEFCYKCGTEIFINNLQDINSEEKTILSEPDDNNIDSEKKGSKSKGKKHKVIGIICLSLSVIFVLLSIICFLNRNSCLSKITQYESNLESLDCVVDEITDLEQDFVEQIELLNHSLDSFDYDTVNNVDDDIEKLEEIGNNLIEKVMEAGELEYLDLASNCDNLDIDGVTENYMDWKDAKLNYIETDYYDIIHSDEYKEMGINARANMLLDANIPFDFSYKKDGEGIVSRISGIDFKSGLKSRISNETTNANNLLIETILLGALAVILLIFFFKGKFRKVT